MVTTYGVIRELVVYDKPRVDPNDTSQSYRGHGIFVLKDKGMMTLKISNDDDFSFLAMVSVLSSAIQYGQGVNVEENPNVHVNYDDAKKELNEVKLHWHLFLNPP